MLLPLLGCAAALSKGSTLPSSKNLQKPRPKNPGVGQCHSAPRVAPGFQIVGLYTMLSRGVFFLPAVSTCFSPSSMPSHDPRLLTEHAPGTAVSRLESSQTLDSGSGSPPHTRPSPLSRGKHNIGCPQVLYPFHIPPSCNAANVDRQPLSHPELRTCVIFPTGSLSHLTALEPQETGRGHGVICLYAGNLNFMNGKSPSPTNVPSAFPGRLAAFSSRRGAGVAPSGPISVKRPRMGKIAAGRAVRGALANTEILVRRRPPPLFPIWCG